MIKGSMISGIICEFNPFHNGHKYLLEQAKAHFPGYIVCVMSGNFVQRGDCAIADKWKRTEWALKNGADLVIELPLPFAVSGAETFARGGIEILNGIGCVDRLVFGSEAGSTEALWDCASFLLSEKFKEEIQKSVNGPINFAKARETIAASCLGEDKAKLLTESNNILGIEYMKSLLSTQSDIVPYTVKRHMVSHCGTHFGKYASASYLRSQLIQGLDIADYVPESVIHTLQKTEIARLDFAERAIFYRLRTMQPEELKEVPDVSEGLEHKVLQAAGSASSLEELYMEVKSKRYSHARIRRVVLSSFLNIERKHAHHIPYLRVLGMNSFGEQILKQRTNTLPFVFGYADVKKMDDFSRELFELEAKADDCYGLMKKTIHPCGKGYTSRPIKC